MTGLRIRYVSEAVSTERLCGMPTLILIYKKSKAIKPIEIKTPFFCLVVDGCTVT